MSLLQGNCTSQVVACTYHIVPHSSDTACFTNCTSKSPDTTGLQFQHPTAHKFTGRDAQDVNTAATPTQFLPLTSTVLCLVPPTGWLCVSFRFSDFHSFHVNNSLHTHTHTLHVALPHSSTPNAATTLHVRRQDTRTHAGMRKNPNENGNCTEICV
jgi:hypothetical protein